MADPDVPPLLAPLSEFVAPEPAEADGAAPPPPLAPIGTSNWNCPSQANPASAQASHQACERDGLVTARLKWLPRQDAQTPVGSGSDNPEQPDAPRRG